jgi:ribosomal protein S19
MSRAKWKSPYLDENTTRQLKESKKNHKTVTTSRTTEILPNFIEKSFSVYNGQKYNEILVTEEMIGHKFGEFVPTRKRFIFKKKKAKK